MFRTLGSEHETFSDDIDLSYIFAAFWRCNESHSLRVGAENLRISTT